LRAKKSCRPSRPSRPRSRECWHRCCASLPSLDLRRRCSRTVWRMEMDKTTSMLVTDHVSVLASFSTHSARISHRHAALSGMERGAKQRYLPRLAVANGSEPMRFPSQLGSDAMNIRTRATLSATAPLHPQWRKTVDHQLRNRGLYTCSPRSTAKIFRISD